MDNPHEQPDEFDTHPDEMQRILCCQAAYNTIAKQVIDTLIGQRVLIGRLDYKIIMESVGEAICEHVVDDLDVLHNSGFTTIIYVPDDSEKTIETNYERLLNEFRI